MPPGVFWAHYGISTPCDQAFWRILRGWKILSMAGQGICSSFIISANGTTFLVSKCFCNFLGRQTILGRQTRVLIAFLAFTSPNDPKLGFFFFLNKKLLFLGGLMWVHPVPKGLVSRAAESYRLLCRHRPHPCLIKFPHFHDPATSFLPEKNPSLPAIPGGQWWLQP